MARDDSFADVMGRLFAGDEEAATEIFSLYARRLVVLASGRLAPWLRHRVDPEDVVQSACKSFFVRHRRGQFKVDDWESLWGLLVVITLRKCQRGCEYFAADRRDSGREVTQPAGDRSEPVWDFVDREPTPPEAAILAETVASLLEGLAAPEREIVELSLQGFTTAEIAKILGRSQRTVQRVRGRVKDRLNHLRDEDVEDDSMHET